MILTHTDVWHNVERKIMAEKTPQLLDEVTIRFAGDSGDGMQLTGTQFTTTAAFIGNDLSTFPDYPAEIRAPQGTTKRCKRISNPFLEVLRLTHPVIFVMYLSL